MNIVMDCNNGQWGTIVLSPKSYDGFDYFHNNLGKRVIYKLDPVMSMIYLINNNY